MPLMPMISTGGPYQPVNPAVVGTSGFASNPWPLANQIIYCRLFVPESFTVKRVFWVNAGTVTGNVLMGLYDASGTKLWAIASTAASGSSQAQFVNVSPNQTHDAGTYFLAMQKSTTGSIFARTPGVGRANLTGSVFRENAGSFALPTTATFAMSTDGLIPLCGLDLRG